MSNTKYSFGLAMENATNWTKTRKLLASSQKPHKSPSRIQCFVTIFVYVAWIHSPLKLFPCHFRCCRRRRRRLPCKMQCDVQSAAQMITSNGMRRQTREEEKKKHCEEKKWIRIPPKIIVFHILDGDVVLVSPHFIVSFS